MARRKNAPDLVKLKCGVAERLRDLRAELYGERGGPELARGLGLPVRTWYNYEAGVTVPAEVILRLIELTRVEPTWLLHGLGPRFREATPDETSVGSLLRAALERLERTPVSPARGPNAAAAAGFEDHPDMIFVRVDDSGPNPCPLASGPAYIAARSEWQAACLEHRCLRVADDAMAPMIAPGAYVAYTGRDADLAEIDGRLVVAWVDGRPPVVRWFHRSARLAVLRAESDLAVTTTVELDTQSPPRFRTVSWISQPR